MIGELAQEIAIHSSCSNALRNLQAYPLALLNRLANNRDFVVLSGTMQSMASLGAAQVAHWSR